MFMYLLMRYICIYEIWNDIYIYIHTHMSLYDIYIYVCVSSTFGESAAPQLGPQPECILSLSFRDRLLSFSQRSWKETPGARKI